MMDLSFVRSALVIPAHAGLLALSARATGARWNRTLSEGRSRLHYTCLSVRTLSCAILSIWSLLNLVLLLVLCPEWSPPGGGWFWVSAIVEGLSWASLAVYSFRLRTSLHWSPRGAKSVLVAWLVAAVVDIICSKCLLDEYAFGSDTESIIWRSFAISQIVCLSVILLTLFPGSQEPLSVPADAGESPDFNDDLSVGLLSLATNGRSGSSIPYLGEAKANCGTLSKLVLSWVNPLIEKGRAGAINQPEDVFELPQDMTAYSCARRYNLARSPQSRNGALQHQLPPQQERVSLLRILLRAFGWQFLGVGMLKFLADCLGFACPIFLNLLVSFIDNRDEPVAHGYYYAVCLSLSTLIVAFCNTHFNLLMSELGIRIRSALVTAVYKQTLLVSSVRLSGFSTGEIINYMSTDTDRVVNFSPSVHAAWSLPLQFAVTLLLLFQQLGVSCLAGVALTIVMVPLNMCIAKAIGSRSNSMMQAKDTRVKTMSEILFGARVIKLFAWENYFLKRVASERDVELRYLKARKYLDALCVYLWATTPVLISVGTFSVYVLLGNSLTAAKVFTSVALFAMLTGPLNAFPWVLNGLIEALVSIRRLQHFLSMEQASRTSYFTPMEEVADYENMHRLDVCVRRAHFDYESRVGLKNVDLEIAKGEFVGVVGRVGSGKSTLLRSLLGDMILSSGHVSMTDPHMGIGYVQQEPWLQQGTIRDNIVFGKEYSHIWYQKVIDACALQDDFLQLARADRTDVGENGAMLSGGQRARVALARAVYQNKEIYLIDDVFSAVDAHVAEHIYNKCIMGLLRNKTRVLCSHHPKFLMAARKVIVVEEGRIASEGPPRMVIDSLNWDVIAQQNEPAEKSSEKNVDTSLLYPDEEAELVEREVRERGVVKYDIYKQYWLSVGKVLSPMILLALLMMQASRNLTDVWLAEWVSRDESNDTILPSRKGDVNVSLYLGIYASIAGANTLFSLARAFLFAYGGVAAARIIHTRLLTVILRAKMLFFDSTPVGRILNRFSSDLYTVDDSLPFILNIFLAQLFGVIGPLIVCVYAVPWIALILLPLGFIYHDIQRKYRPASRDLKRVGSVSLSPIYAHFSETLSGLSVIRGMKDSPRFANGNATRIEASQRAQYAGVAAAQWLELRLQLIGCAVVGGIAFVAVIQHHTVNNVNPGYIGLAISYALGITGRLSDLIKTFTETEKELVAVERCYQYIDNTATEDINIETDVVLSGQQPREGVVRFDQVCLRYREHLPDAITNVSFETAPGEKLGISGRTGSGKSSLFHALFRTVPIHKGVIYIDGTDIASMELRELRKSLAIIPQDPFLFSGTVRENLDPLGESTDGQLWDTLTQAHMREPVQRLGGLDSVVQERGRAFSVGERQLFCLARAILSKAKVICIDEATANVDMNTDKLVQQILCSALHDRTVLTIAHRLDSLKHCNRIISMSEGQAKIAQVRWSETDDLA